MRATIFIVIFFLSNSIFGQTISLQDYFPLKNGTIREFYVSQIKGTDTIKDINDSSICKLLIVKGKEIYYFEDELDSGDNAIIGAESFCEGVFYYNNGVFMFSPLFWKYELKQANLDYFEPLFPATITIGTEYKHQEDEEKITYKFDGFENITIKKQLYKDCLKLTIIQDWPTDQYVDTVWFQKGFGVVKWLRGTGRLEELKQ